MDALIRRVDQLEGDVKGIKGTLERLEPMIVRIDERLKSVASKEDIAATRQDLGKEIAATRQDLGKEIAATRQDLAKVAERVGKVEGAVERLPTTLHLLGFVLAVLGFAGLAKYFAL